ncbi:uncharacterized protein J3D65DRAFT_663371 [Phyllosticta citribraziliensis]|uniref:Uncharacterized protein n=1 Tax=Phyllosticta citribraziliensis TaxID=989973 RepID=A0ABR1MBW9_9PEZI
MSDKLMDTAPGGQSTQYESIKQFTNPPDKDVGQLGDPTNATKSASTSTQTYTGKNASLNKSAPGAGEALGSSGSADEEAEQEQRARREQGYGGERDMRRDVGA